MIRPVSRLRDSLLARLASSLRGIAATLDAWATTLSRRSADTSSPRSADGLAPDDHPGSGPPEHWVALLRERAPHLLEGGLLAYRTPVGLRRRDLPGEPSPPVSGAAWGGVPAPGARPANALFPSIQSEPRRSSAEPTRRSTGRTVPGGRREQTHGDPTPAPATPGDFPPSPPRSPAPLLTFDHLEPRSTPPSPGRRHPGAEASRHAARHPSGVTGSALSGASVEPEPARQQPGPAPVAGVRPEPAGPRPPPYAANPADHRSWTSVVRAPGPLFPSGPGPAEQPLSVVAGEPPDRRSPRRFLSSPRPHRPPLRFTPDPPRTAATPPRWVGDPAGGPGPAVFEAPRRAEELWPALPAVPLPATDQSLDDAGHLARLEREQEGR